MSAFADREVVLFDLDGTVSDSARGILGSLRRAFLDHGLTPIDPAVETVVLGPPMVDILPRFMPAELVPRVIETYRGYYGGGGMFETDPYPGVPALLARLRADRRRIAVATSKAEAFAVPVVEKLGLSGVFDVVGGDDLDGSRPTKAAVIAHVLAQLGAPAATDVVMIGDRHHDVHGAREHGLDCLGVRWGYGGPGELEAAGAAAVADDVAALARLLGVGDAG